MFFDPLYLIVMGIGLALSVGAQFWVKSKVNEWSEVHIQKGLTGREIAQAILHHHDIQDVHIEEVQGFMTDHYSPGEKVLRLSPDHYRGDSVAAAGIAAHEVGHAIQDKQGYWPMRIRQRMVPVANIGTNLGIWLVLGGLLLGISGLAKIGVALFAGFVVFTLVTLPVEFDASSRAKEALDASEMVTAREHEGISEVLTAAAATYVAAAVTAVLQLLYFALRAGVLGEE